MTEIVKWDGVAYLRTRHTRVLMQMRESAYRVSGYNYAADRGKTEGEIFYDPFDTGQNYVSLAQIKAELATREHVPNKKEARQLRQQRASNRRR